MTDSDFRALCNVYGFAPSRALRELIDCVIAQEIAACAKVCDTEAARLNSICEARPALVAGICAAAIRARKEKP